MQTINNRIIQLIDSECSGNKRAFSKIVGVAPSVVENVVGSRGTKPSFDVLEKILNAFAHISADWLVTGKGDQFLKQNAHPKNIQNLHTHNTDLHTQIAHPIPEIERGVKCIDCAETPAGGIPLIPIDAAAGFLSGVGAQVLEYECERYLIPGFKGAEFLIRISGDSMTPKYESGDIVACQRLESDTFLQWNKVYVVDSEQGVLIKRIKPGRADDTLTLVSDNIEYAPFEIDRRQVFGLGRVIGLVRLE